MVASKGGGNPCPPPDVVVDMGNLWQHARNDLDATRSISYHGGSFALARVSACIFPKSPGLTHGIIIALIPTGTMLKLALEVVQARDIWPLPRVQCASCGDQYITFV